MKVRVNTGSDATIATSPEIDATDFGAIYTSFRDFSNFNEQIQGLGVGRIVWPGGFLAEQRPDNYGFNFEDLQSPNPDKPGLTELFTYAKQNDLGLTIVLPTYRYRDDLETLRDDVRKFAEDLVSGKFGAPPEDLTFDIGSEYYAHFDGADRAIAYGKVANVMLEEFGTVLNDPIVNPNFYDVDLSVQMGKRDGEDEAIRSQLSDLAKQTVDLVSHNRFAVKAEGFDKRGDDVTEKLAAWNDDVTDAGGSEVKLAIGGFNVFSYTRKEALDDFVKEKNSEGISVDRSSVDLAQRTNTEFENFYQSRLNADLGAAHPRLILEAYSEYQKINLEHATMYGFDVQHSGRLTYEDVDGNPQQLIGAKMYQLMAESIDGTRQIDLGYTTDKGDPLWMYGYENEDKLVLFFAADETAPGSVTVSIDGLGSTYKAVAAEKLTGEVPDNWMELFGVPDNPNVDESNEAKTYTFGKVSPLTPRIEPGGLTFNMAGAHDVVRMSFAKTDKGLAEIRDYSDAPVRSIDLDDQTDPDTESPTPTEETDPDQDDVPGDNEQDNNSDTNGGTADDRNRDDDKEKNDEEKDSDATCFIATAAYGDPWHPDVKFLRHFRDTVLTDYRLGRLFVRFYWWIGPKMARHVSASGRSGLLSRKIISAIVRILRRMLH